MATAPGVESVPPGRGGWIATAIGLAAACILMVVTLWLIGQFLRHRPQDLRTASAEFAEIAADVLKYQGLPPEAIEISAPALRRVPSAHYYTTRVAAYLPASLPPGEVVAALERALWPKRIVITEEHVEDSEHRGVFSLDGHPVGEVTVHHTRSMAEHREQAPSISEGPHSPEPHATPAPTPEPALETPASSESAHPEPETKALAGPVTPQSDAVEVEPPVQVPGGQWSPGFGAATSQGAQKVARGSARVAIIIDDGGYGGEVADVILGLDPRLTLSILPNTPHGTALAEDARRRGFEVMLHMPMENTSPTLVHPGQLDGRMEAREIQRLTREALAQIPGAKGINNHTGSKFTADSRGLGRFMEGLRDSGLYFIDSRTTQESVAYEVARQFQIPAAERTVFLDDERDTESVEARFTELLTEAKARGAAIGIGHFRPATALALKTLLPTLAAEGVELVHASELVQ